MHAIISRPAFALYLLGALILVLQPDPRLAGMALLAAGAAYLRRGTAPRGPVRSNPAGWGVPTTGPKPVTHRARRALVIGSGTVAETLAASLEESDRYRVVGFVDQNPLCGSRGWCVLGAPDDLPQLVDQHSVEEIFVALPPFEEELRLARLLGTHPGVKLSVVPTAYHSLMRLPDVQSYGDLAVVPVGTRVSRWTALKRGLDLVISAALLLLLAPVMGLTALAIRCTSEGPALFRQDRVGLDGSRFTLFKFRTMVANAEALTGPTLSSGHDDPRLTPLGKFLRRSRLDELPQLWNVLRGEMSLIGPRPERPCFVERFGEVQPLYLERHRVRPGITGLAQVRAGYHTDARDKLRYDLLYVSHPSPWLDLEIAVRTIGVMFKLCG